MLFPLEVLIFRVLDHAHLPHWRFDGARIQRLALSWNDGITVRMFVKCVIGSDSPTHL
jgi:hypothetical protein